jgi:hypothetical protein
MRGFVKFFPFFISVGTWAQSSYDADLPIVEFGYCTSTFSGIDIGHALQTKQFNSDIHKRTDANTLPNLSYGWKEGTFLWFNVCPEISIKAQTDFGFCVNNYKTQKTFEGRQTAYSVSYGLDIKPQLIIKLRKVDHHPIIKMAKCMSYYLSGKQSYLIIGPKISYQKTDNNFLNGKGASYFTVGNVIGIGVDHMFPNLDFSPEIYVSLDYQPGKSSYSPIASNRFFASLTLAVSIF